MLDGLSRRRKRIISYSSDLLLLLAALWVAFSVRLEVLYLPPAAQWWIFPLAPLLALPLFSWFGLYRSVTRYIGFQALATSLKVVTLYALLWTLVLLTVGVEGTFPRSVYLLNYLFAVLFIMGSRVAARWYILNRPRLLPGWVSATPVLIYGAGSAGIQLAQTISLSREMRVVAFIDDNPTLQGSVINGVRVHSITDLAALLEQFAPSTLLLSLPSISHYRRREILAQLEPYALRVLTVPSLQEINEGRVRIDAVREVEIADLLGRDAVPADAQLLRENIYHKVVMVTGAGGTIGSELCRQILSQAPQQLLLFDLNEYALYQIERELLLLKGERPTAIVPLLGSVTDSERLAAILHAFTVNTIYHAAAYKHVPMVEKNPGEAVINNVVGSWRCAEAALAAGVATFVLISTDKAVRPTNTMGATKRIAELVLQALSRDPRAAHTRFTMVRFGNVLGSSGSVVPLFREQIKTGGPVTVTDARIIRYFMTIPEAAELVIQAGAMGEGGDVFVLDMGEPGRILDLARRMIRLSGYEVRDENHPDGDVEIRITGLRPGEKLYEELLIGDNVVPTRHPKIMRAHEEVIPWPELFPLLTELEQQSRRGNYGVVRQILHRSVAGYDPQCGIEDLIYQQQRQKDLPLTE
ncbi:MAG: polysaccharide biosynthesis protein [Gammaproteobacteria bacterium]|nr:polysaccharide biosynthesis protein [Gammaproteobacteria bacterium]